MHLAYQHTRKQTPQHGPEFEVADLYQANDKSKCQREKDCKLCMVTKNIGDRIHFGSFKG
jgi:hypothetical protein